MEYKGKIAGINYENPKANEITADDIAILRKYIFGWDYGVLDIEIAERYINEVSKIKTQINNEGELLITYPEDYQGTTFRREGEFLIAETNDLLEKINIKKIGQNLYVEE